MHVKFVIIPTGKIDEAWQEPTFQVERFEEGRSLGLGIAMSPQIQREMIDVLKTLLTQGNSIEITFTSEEGNRGG